MMRVHSVKHRRGMAMMLVICAVALAAVLGYATLATVGVQAQISENADAIAQADCLAESGFNYAMYNLEFDATKVPTGSTPYTSPALSLPGTASNAGTYVVSTALVPPTGSLPSTTYQITSTGSVVTGSVNPTTIKRMITATVYLDAPPVQPNQAGGFNSGLTFSLLDSIKGDVRVSGVFSLLGSIVGGSVIQNLTTNPAPTVVTDYSTYAYGGLTYSATLLAADPAAGSTLGPTSSNPAGVYLSNNRTLNLRGVTINGSLIVKNGDIMLTNSSTNTITPQTGFPGLVVGKGTSNAANAGEIRVNGNNETLTVNGLVWAQYGIDKVGLVNLNSSITINGSLLVPTASPLHGYLGALALNYTAANVNVPNFSTQTPRTVRVLNWAQ